MTIGDKIKELREEKGLTQTELGAIAGVTDKAVSTWEKGLREPRMGAVEKLSSYFNIPKSELLCLSDENPERSTPLTDKELDELRDDTQLLAMVRQIMGATPAERERMRAIYDLLKMNSADPVSRRY